MSRPGDPAKDAKLTAAQPITPSQEQDFQQAMKDIHFDFDRADLRQQDRAILAGDADWLKAHPDVMITLEDDADERGTIIYNPVLAGGGRHDCQRCIGRDGGSIDRIAATGRGKLYQARIRASEQRVSGKQQR